jgi:hypothetical protein
MGSKFYPNFDSHPPGRNNLFPDFLSCSVLTEGKEVKVCLRDLGSYLKFNKECLYKGYKSSMVDTYLSQLFAAPATGQNRQDFAKVNNTARFETKNIEGKQLPILQSISNKIKENRDKTYMDEKYNPGPNFQGSKVDKSKTRKIVQEHFPKFLQVKQLIKIFKNRHDDIRVTKVWFLKKKDKGDRFVKFHYDYKEVGGGSNDVFFIVVVNLGKLNVESENATINISQSNEEPRVLTGSRRVEMMQKPTPQDRYKC